MKRFIEYLKESEEFKHIVIIVGKFRPVTLGHCELVDAVKKNKKYASLPLVVLLTPAFPKDIEKSIKFFEIQKKMLSDNVKGKNITYKMAEESFVPNIISNYMKDGIKIDAIFCGADRYEEFKEQVEKKKQMAIKGWKNRHGDKPMPESWSIDTVIEETPRDESKVSGSLARKALKNGDKKEFKRICGPKSLAYFDELSELLV